MKNVLFIGPYRQSDGWGNASKEYLRALKKTKYNVVSRPVYLNAQRTFETTNEFTDTENKHCNSYDVVIQNCLPHMFRKLGRVKNIGISFFESTVKYTPWIECIKMMDEMWVSSEFEQQLLMPLKSKVIPIPVDTQKYYMPFRYNNYLEPYSHEYKFYFIGELIERKNVEALIKAFHLEFAINEPVRLVLKVNKVGMSQDQVRNFTGGLIKNIKESLGRYDNLKDYKVEIVIPNFLSSDDINGIHAQCDCFVMPSSGEGFCIPALDAVGFGSFILVNRNSSMNQFMTDTDDNGILVDSHESPATSKDKPLRFLYNGLDQWYTVDLKSLMNAMRTAYEHRHDKTILKERNKTKISSYSYDTVAKRMEELI